MRPGALRAALAPVVLVAAVVLAVRPPPQPAPAPAAPVPQGVLFSGTPEQAGAAGALWSAWARDLTADGSLPVELAALDAREALYVVLTVRAAQVGAAVEAAGPQVSPDEAVAAAGLAPQPADVTTARVPGVAGCVVLDYAREPFGRSFYGRPGAPEQPGPEPQSALERVLLRTAGIGLGPADAPDCGQGVAYSPPAQKAVAALAPALLR